MAVASSKLVIDRVRGANAEYARKVTPLGPQLVSPVRIALALAHVSQWQGKR